MRKLSLVFLFSIIAALTLTASPVHALRSGATDWYIDRFDSDITLNTDGSLSIREDITADCGQCVDKHGIFRVLPTRTTVEGGKYFGTPITLESITDEKGNSYTYSTITDSDTVTWKIGDPDVTVQGVHRYIISYRVDNAVRKQDAFDELYWNVLGPAWDLEIDSLHATLHLPNVLSNDKTSLSLYAGPAGTKEGANSWITSQWVTSQTLAIDSIKPFPSYHGATFSLSFPQDIISSALPHEKPFWESFWFLLVLCLSFPLLTFILCFKRWNDHGKDPQVSKTIIAEYEAPEKLSPLMLQAFLKYGTIEEKGVAAFIIDMAVHGVLVIRQTREASFFQKADYEIEKQEQSNWKRELGATENELLNAIFGDKSVVGLTSLKNVFSSKLALISSKTTKDELLAMGLIDKKNAGAGMIGIGVLFVFVGFSLFSVFWPLAIIFLTCGAIVFIFGTLMPRRTQKGAEALWRAKGFELFMKTAERYRQQFNEKEHIFEELLPYAIVFGITQEWIKKVQEMNIPEMQAGHSFIWLTSTQGIVNDIESFTSQLNSITESVHSANYESSGSGGSGSSGGGGGGGGGGGW